MKDIWKVGIKDVYVLHFTNLHTHKVVWYCYNKKLTATGDQLVMLADGSWERVDRLVKDQLLMSHQYRAPDGIHKATRLYREGHTRASARLIEKKQATPIQYKVMKVEKLGKKLVYDIEMEHHHNFVCRGLVLHNSTRKEEYGTMQRLLNRAKQDKRVKGGFKIYKWCIWEILEQCTRHCTNDKEYGLCPIIDICNGRAKKCSGFYKVDDFIDKVAVLDKDTLDTQWFNKKPSTEVYVYGRYWQGDRTKTPCHILPTRKKDGKSTIDWLLETKDIEKVAAIDFGSSPGHPFVYKLYFCDVRKFKREVEVADPDDIITSKITFYVVYEYRNSQATTEERATKIKISPYWTPDIPIFADPSARMERINLEGQGVYTYAADNDLLDGIANVRSYLQFREFGKANLYYVDGYFDCDENLEDSTEEYKKYKYRRMRDGQVNRKEPMPTHDHGLDCDRYVMNSAPYYFKQTYMSVVEEVEGGFWA
jgi:hypothetical protein